MKKLIAVTALQLIANAAGLIVAALVLDGFNINFFGFIVSVAFFAIASLAVEPVILKLSAKYLPALRGGVALITTYVALLLTAVFTNGLTIDGLSTWVLASFIIWLCVAVAGSVLPMFIFKETLAKSK